MQRTLGVHAPGVAISLVLAALVTAGCASQNPSASVAASGGDSGAVAGAPRPVVLTGATFLTEGETPRLLLSGEGPLSPTVYSRDDARRIVVDLPNVVTSPGMEPPRVKGGLLSRVEVRSFTEMGVPHVQFELAAASALDTKIGTEPGSSALAIAFFHPAPAAAEPGAVLADASAAPVPEPAPITIETLPSRPSGTALASSSLDAAPATAQAGQPVALVRHTPKGTAATRLLSVAARRSPAGAVVTLAGDGPFAYEGFLLADPPRYVVDLGGVRNVSKGKAVDVKSGAVSRVRVSQFRSEAPLVTRVVFDLESGVLPELLPTANGLSVSFGRQQAPQPEALTAELRAPSAPAKSSAAIATDAASPALEAAAPKPAAQIPAAKSYEPHETEDPAEKVVTEMPAPSQEPSAAAPAAVTAEAPMTPQPAEPVAEIKIAAAQSAPVEMAPVEKTSVPPPPPVKKETPRPAPAVTAPEIRPEGNQVKVVEKAAPQIVAPSVELPQPPAPSPARPRERRKPAGEDRALIEAAEALLQEQEGSPDKPKDLGGASFESRAIGTADKVYTGEPISLNLKDADIKDTLQKFAELTGLNIVIDPSVRGTVTVSLNDIPWDQALELILKINGLGYQLEGNVMRISSLGQLAREEDQRRELLRAQDQNRPLKTVIQKLSYASATDVASTARRVMSSRGDIFTDDRSNTVIIKELPDYLPTVLDLIKNLDTPTPQVMIEARIIEATRTFSRNLGIDWSFTGLSDSAHGNTTGLIFPNNLNVNGQVSLPNGNPLLGFSAGNVLDTFRLDVTLSAAEARGLLKVISSPRIQTQTNQSASIQSGFQIPVQTTVNNTTTVLYVDATLRLQVTPQITAEGTVVMTIQIQKREPAIALNVTGGGNTPLITRDAQTKLMVKDGGTAVIGGIFKLTANDQQNMIPGLWKIPFLGNLFRNKTIVENTDELLIFITPRIMR